MTSAELQETAYRAEDVRLGNLLTAWGAVNAGITTVLGLQNVRTTQPEIYPSPDFVKLALAAELSADPGTAFAYNNKAVNLLAGIVNVASGRRLDHYLRDEVFAPLGIVDFTWTLDPAGNPHAMSGLQIRALDLARIGLMMLDGGRWKGKTIVPRWWVQQSTAASQSFNPTCGLLWWRLGDFRYVARSISARAESASGLTPRNAIRRSGWRATSAATQSFSAATAFACSAPAWPSRAKK